MPGPAYHGRTHLAGGTDPIPGLDAGGGGIQFDTDPQAGTWLVLTATGSTTHGSLGTAGIFLETTGSGGIRLRNTSSGPFQVRNSGNGAIDIQTDGSGAISIYANGTGDLYLTTDAGFLGIQSAGGMGIESADELAIQTSVGSDIVLTSGSDIRLSATTSVNIDTAVVYAVSLPTSAGASGSLYVDGSGFVKRA